MLTPSMLARKRLVNHSALAPLVVYTDAALPKSLAFSISIASSHEAHSYTDRTGPNTSSRMVLSDGDR
jgi:hypothetical protein